MLSCINKSSKEFQELKKVSGIPEQSLEIQCRKFITKYNRFPNLDELYDVDSEPYLRSQLKGIRNSCKLSDLLELTHTNSVQEAIASLNNKYKDLQITAIQLQNSVIFDIKHKAKIDSEEAAEYLEQDAINSTIVLNNVVNKLQSLYGINIVPITNLEISQDKELSQLVGNQQANAFVYNDTIYVNTDVASIDAPLHELLHIFVGSMRQSNPELYYSLVQSAEQFETYDLVAQMYPNRTQADLDEEVFIHELSNYLVGETNDIDSLPDDIKNQILYNTRSVINSVLMGSYNANGIVNPYTYSLRELSGLLNSNLCATENTTLLKDARLSRLLANKKQELMENKELQEDCQ